MKHNESTNYILAIIALVAIVAITWFVLNTTVQAAATSKAVDTAGAASNIAGSASQPQPITKTLVAYDLNGDIVK